jgi:hypothetical protein
VSSILRRFQSESRLTPRITSRAALFRNVP